MRRERERERERRAHGKIKTYWSTKRLVQIISSNFTAGVDDNDDNDDGDNDDDAVGASSATVETGQLQNWDKVQALASTVAGDSRCKN